MEQRVTWPINDVGYRQLIPPVSVIPRAGLGKICAQDKDDFNDSLHLLHVPMDGFHTAYVTHGISFNAVKSMAR